MGISYFFCNFEDIKFNRMDKSTTATKRKKNPVDIADIGRLQPQALELEKAVLGALMLEKDAFYEVSEILKDECFYEPRHQDIFKAIQQLAVKQKPVDILTVQEQLKLEGVLEEVGGAYYLAELSSKVVSTAHLEYHARIVAQKHLARALISYTSEIQGDAYDEAMDVDELMQKAESKLFELSQQNLKKDVIQINPIIDEALNILNLAAKREDGLSGIESGFHALDKITSGWQNSDLIIIAARPAMGKTALALSMIRNMAVDNKQPVAIFSMEMSNVQLVNRLIVNVCEIEGEKIKSGRLQDFEWYQLDQKIKDLYDAPIFIDDTPSLSVFEFATKARQLIREHQIKLIVIDYLQLMNASAKGLKYANRQEEVMTISRSLKALAKELNIPIIALSQVNRASANRAGIMGVPVNEAKRPQLSDLRESGAIEQDADLVVFIHRPEYYRILEDENQNSLVGIAELIIAKHRNGATGDIRLRFRSNFAKFSNLEDDAFFNGEDQPILSSRVNYQAGEDFDFDTDS